MKQSEGKAMFPKSDSTSTYTSKSQKWFTRLFQRVTTVFVIAAVCTILYIILLYTLQWLWIVYSATKTGQIYIQSSPDVANLIQSVLEMNFVRLAFELVLLATIKGTALAFCGQLLLLIRFAYEYRPFIVKTLLWGVPLAALIANSYMLSADLTFETAFLLALLPGLCMINPLIQLARETIPDLGTIFTTLKKRLKKESELPWH
jgi:hypothetical protein